MTQPPTSGPGAMLPGTLFVGDFVVEHKIGEGGMGAVYAVHQRSTGVRRALKVMGASVLQDPRSWERFEREARISARIRSEHVVKVITAGIEPHFHTPYLVMEFLEGEGLDARLRRGPVSVGDAQVILAQLCHGLAEMHALGIVHRDIKPENIFFARSHRVDVPFTIKLLDFGIAKTLNDAAASGGMTQAVGTPRTMAPEQADPRLPISPATDVWALGLVAFNLLTGRSFWLSANHADGTLQGLLAELMNLPIPTASTRLEQLGLVASLPPGFDPWLLRCLERDPRARFPTAAEAWSALSPVLGGSYGYSIQTPHGTLPPPSGSAFAESFGPLTPSPYASGPYPSGSLPPSSAPLGVTPSGHPADRVLSFAATAPPPASSQGGTAPLSPALLHESRDPRSVPTPPAPAPSGPSGPFAPSGPPVGVDAPTDPAPGANVAAARTAALATTAATATTAGTATTATTAATAVATGAGARRRRVLGSIALALALALGLLQWGRPRTSYCREVQMLRTDVACVDEVTAEQATRRTRTFRVQRRWGKTRRVDALNGAGFPAADEQGLASYGYEYGRGGVITRVTALDERGRTVVQLVHRVEQRRLEVQGPDGAPRRYPDAPYSAQELDFDESGRVRRVRFLTDHGAPAADARGAFGHEQRFDGRGRLVERTTLGSDGQPSHDDRWVERVELARDERGEVVEERFLTADGKPASSQDGCARLRYERSEAGNVTRVGCHDDDGKPAFYREGYSGWTTRHDARGNLIERRRVGPDGTTTHDRGGVAIEQFAYDDRGRVVEAHYLAVDGSPTLNAQGVAGFRLRRDERGDEVERTYLDPSGVPTFHHDGYATARMRYDAQHRQIEVRYLDPEGKPTFHADGYAMERLAYDDQDRVRERSYFDTQEQPTLTAERYAVQRLVYDERGNLIEERYQGLDGKPTRTSGWYAARLRRYDDRGNEIETSLLGPDGKPTRHKDGYSTVRRRYNERNEAIEWSYFNAAGQPSYTNRGVAQVRVRYDRLGRVVERSNLDTAGRLAPDDGGDVQERYVLDVRGDMVERAFFDALGQSMVSRQEGYATRRTLHNERGQATEERFFDAEGKPRSAQPAIRRTTYDERGNPVEQSYFDASERPVAGDDGAAMVRWKRDARGEIIEWAHFDTNGKPTRLRDGYAIARTTLDPKGKQIDWSYFDAEGNPTRFRGYVRTGAAYDERGRRVEARYLDETGSLTTPEGKGAPLLRFRHDARGNLIEELLLGADGKPPPAASVVRREYIYDERDLLVETRPYGRDGQITSDHLIVRTVYDDRGQRVEVSYFDASGQRAATPQGQSVERITRDEQGRVVERTFLDHQLQPVTHREFQATRLRYSYDDQGRMRGEECFDGSGKLLRTNRFGEGRAPER